MTGYELILTIIVGMLAGHIVGGALREIRRLVSHARKAKS